MNDFLYHTSQVRKNYADMKKQAKGLSLIRPVFMLSNGMD